MKIIQSRKLIRNRDEGYVIVISAIIYFIVNFAAHFLYVPLKCFFMDDVALFLQFQEETMFSYLLHGHDNKFRPISDFFLYIGYKMFGTNTEYAYVYILIIGTIISAIICFLVIQITEDIWFGFCISICLSVSRFAYYAVGQYFGIMENITLLNAILTLYYGLKFLLCEQKNIKRYYILMNLFSILCIFSHERYLTIYGYLLAVIFIKYFLKKESLKYYIGIFASIALMFLFRLIYLGDNAFQGTNASNLIEGFDIIQILSFFKDGVLLLFGWNAGASYLNGIELQYVSLVYNIIPIIFLLSFITLSVLTVVQALKDKEYLPVKVIGAIICFVGVTLISGCITIRLEMRWLYIPYIGFMILLYYMLFNIGSKVFIKKSIKVIISCILLCCTIIMELYFRPYWQNNYLGPEFKKYNDIYEAVIQRYGEELYYRPVLIVENIDNGTKIVDEGTINRIFLTYCNMGTVEWIYKNSFSEIPQELFSRNPIILYIEQLDKTDIWEKEVLDVTNLYSRGTLSLP